MDSNLTQRRRGLEEKIPDIRKTLSMVEYLRDRRVRLLGVGGILSSPPGLSLRARLFIEPITLFVVRFSFLPSLRKRKIGQRRVRTQAMTMTLMTSARTNSRMIQAGSPNLSRRPLSLPTRSTPRQSSKKRTQCTYGLEYVLCPSPFSPLRHLDHFNPAQANVMLSYKIPAAIELLNSKLEAANVSLNNTVEDLEFIREQMTVMEVNTARVYNWDVKRRREEREKERLSGEGAVAT